MRRVNESITSPNDHEDGDEEETEDESKEDDPIIMAPSFIPFADTADEPSPQRTNGRKNKSKKKKRNRSSNDRQQTETENLAKMYEQQQSQQHQPLQQHPPQQYPGYHPNPPRPNQQHWAQHPSFSTPAAFNMGLNMMPPPPMTGNPNRDQALSNMLLAWYWNGYYAGYSAANSHRQ